MILRKLAEAFYFSKFVRISVLFFQFIDHTYLDLLKGMDIFHQNCKTFKFGFRFHLEFIWNAFISNKLASVVMVW